MLRCSKYQSKMDTDILFHKYTIEEIRNIEKKTRQDIETKKEDLRLMVGERYRDLIQAADTITDMKNSAENVMLTISNMQELCQNMRVSFQLPYTDRKKLISEKRQEQSHYVIGAQIKQLLDMPEKIWSALDSNHHLHATCLFLLSRHINTSLQLDSKQSTAVATHFPILNKQWATVSHFRTAILQTCREQLKNGDVSDEVATECLCSILLLEDGTPRQVFNEFLLARTNAVQEQLKSDSAGVKGQICEVMKILTTTIHQIYTIFYSGEVKDLNVVNNLLMTTLGQVTEKHGENTVMESLVHDHHISKKYLPDNVKEFRPNPRNQANPVSVSTLQGNSQQWIETCIKSVNTGVNKLLSFVTSVKGLAAIKSDIWDLLHEDENMKTWDSVCMKILNRKLSLWEEFLRPLFCDRAKAILQSQFDGALDSCRQQVAKVLGDIGNLKDKSANNERDLSSYVWTENISDLPANTAWVPLSSRTVIESGSLVMKAKAYTPAIQSLCKNLDNKLKVVLEDSSYYTGSVEKEEENVKVNRFSEESGSAENKDKDADSPFNKYADREMIYTFLQNTCDQCIAKLLQHLKQQLYGCKQQLANSNDVVGNKTIIDRILLLARFSTSLSELSPNLENCVISNSNKKESSSKSKKYYSVRGQSKIQEDPKWTELKQKLVTFGEDAFNTWIEYTSKLLLGQFKTGLLDNSGQAVLHSLTKWDEIEIEEETEDGKSVKSVIKVPMQPSWYVQALLYNVCEEINRIGGHALQRSILNQLASEISDELLDKFDRFLRDKKSSKKSEGKGIPFSQTRALQLYFDVKFIGFIFPRKDEGDGNKKYQKKLQKVLSSVEGEIDPFDFDVFSPYMAHHLARQSQRCQILYGALASLDQHGSSYTITAKAYTGQQEQHNILPLTYVQNRFPLLPLSGQNRGAQSVMEPPKPKAITRTTISARSSSPPPSIPVEVPRRTSILDQMSTIWFNTKT